MTEVFFLCAALHIAAYYGQGLLIDQLVKHQAIVDATDYLGLTPLHLACQRGYQNVMVGSFYLLLHLQKWQIFDFLSWFFFFK